MYPSIWGKHAWNFMHLITLEYPENPDKHTINNYKSFIYSLTNILPCEKCRNNLSKHLQNKPITDEIMSSRISFVKYIIDLHNIVNFETNKPVLSYEDSLKKINELLDNDNKICINKSYLIVFIIIIIIIITLIYLKFKN